MAIAAADEARPKGHHLHEAPGAGAADRVLAEAALDLDQPEHQRRLQSGAFALVPDRLEKLQVVRRVDRPHRRHVHRPGVARRLEPALGQAAQHVLDPARPLERGDELAPGQLPLREVQPVILAEPGAHPVLPRATSADACAGVKEGMAPRPPRDPTATAVTEPNTWVVGASSSPMTRRACSPAAWPAAGETRHAVAAMFVSARRTVLIAPSSLRWWTASGSATPTPGCNRPPAWSPSAPPAAAGRSRSASPPRWRARGRARAAPRPGPCAR